MDYITLNEANEYIGREQLSAEEVMRYIHSASRHIDTLTFGRINKIGFDNLTDFQQGIIKESTAMLAKFEYDNREELATTISSYSINGVSVSFGDGFNVKIQNGVAVSSDIFNLLSQSGLTTLRI